MVVGETQVSKSIKETQMLLTVGGSRKYQVLADLAYYSHVTKPLYLDQYMGDRSQTTDA